MTEVSLRSLTKRYAGATAVSDLNLDIASGQLTALLGPSGCGKTTILKLIAGILEPSSGDICFDGRSVLKTAPENRGAVMVFQDGLLFPYMSVEENIGFGLKMRKHDAQTISRRVSEMLELVQLPGVQKQMPQQLSGGQQQRVALARALIVRPDVLLLDEPLSSLDAHLRDEMQELLRSLQQQTGITTLVVTHDQEEAMILAESIALILDGELHQHDEAEAFYQRPADEATARFFGAKNFIEGVVEDDKFHAGIGTLILPGAFANGPGKLTIRPEYLRTHCGRQQPNVLTAKVLEKTFLGSHARLELRIADERLTMMANPVEVESILKGQTLAIEFPVNALWVLNAS